LVFYDSAKFCITDRAAKEKRMTHSDKGNYAGRHSGAVEANEAVIQAVRNTARNGAISCASAHSIAHTCAVSPEEAGRAIDAAEIRIAHCQLGIFKHSADRPAVPTDVTLTAELEKAFAAGVINKRLPCAAAWSIAESFKLTRAQIGAACDRLGIKISACQLGTFR
jgi:hypothetical protein